MIKIINGNFQRLGVLKNVITATRTEEINGENTLDFTAVLDSKINNLLSDDAMLELNDEYFDVARMLRNSNEDGTYTIDIEAEHVSYRLNDPRYDVESFLGSEDATETLRQILHSTGFYAAGISFSAIPIYDIRESRSRRKLLMDFVDYIGGEIIFRNFAVYIVERRGDPVAKAAVKDNNVRVISEEFNKRKLDSNGNPLISYTCRPVNLPSDSYELGDAVTLIERTINVREDLRVVRIQYNPYLPTEVELVFGTYINGFEAPFYQVENKANSVADSASANTRDWDNLKIRYSGFTITSGLSVWDLKTEKDSQGKIISVNDDYKKRTVEYP